MCFDRSTPTNLKTAERQEYPTALSPLPHMENTTIKPSLYDQPRIAPAPSTVTSTVTSPIRSSPRIELFTEELDVSGPLSVLVVQCVNGLLSTNSFMELLAKTILAPDASPGRVQSFKGQIEEKLRQHSPIPIGSKQFAKISIWGTTCHTRYKARMYISSSLTKALESTNLAAPNSMFLAILGVAIIAHELCHWVRAELHFPITPPTRHASRFYSYSKIHEDLVHGESGYLLETRMWGGVAFALFQNERDKGDISRLDALCLETGPLWTVDQFRNNNGPPTSEYILERLDLQQHLIHMRNGQEMRFPLFNVSRLEMTGRRYQYHLRLRGDCDGEGGEEVSGYHTDNAVVSNAQS
ncbi:hypothetical protein C8R45DRAFT_610247 [Mycena sanguinolenta]|nr:hypothetical protein C8R45DRAFT_610247 [Mycena sanguinolenta]